MDINTKFVNNIQTISMEVSLFQRIIKKIFIPFSLLMLLNIVFAFIYIIFCNSPDDWNGMDDDKDTFMVKLFKRLYFSMTTISTVGFGDISPKSIKARSIVMLQFVFVILELLSAFI